MLLGIDAGGTFTDFVLVRLEPTVGISVHKTLSTPDTPERAILNGIQAMGLESYLDDGSLLIVHGSTVATNAVLEGKLARTAFITNYGFADMLQLARQTRPELYALETPAVPPPVPSELCLETGGRVAADGTVVLPLTETELDELLQKLESLAPDAVAINLLFSF
ncbi:MAG: hydantoinase/oxoprolinase family protein, partial [Gammaproteobacteria bacterium]|nr:hydantoinase/oxoprolinase family protein [Gammaproteobacteria bacterium]